MENKNNWGEVGNGRRSGVLVPLFSIYSRRSAGIGDLEDLKLLTDWCEKTGNSIMQLLPMNEVGDNFCPNGKGTRVKGEEKVRGGWIAG